MNATPAKATASWPTHPDGSNKRMGEMTRDEQQAQRKASNARVMNPLPAALAGPDEC